MKKFLIILLCVIIILSPMRIVKSAEAIELTQASFDLLNNGIDLLSYSGSVPYGFLPVVFSSEKDYQSVLEDQMQKEDVFIVDGNANIQIRPLTDNEYGLLENAYVYDDDGNIVSLSQLYYGESDNGYFTEKFYCKNDGSIVYQDQAKDNPYIDVKFGGSEYSYAQWQNMYDSLSDSLDSNSYHYNLNGDTVGNVTFYYAVGQTVGGNPSYAASLFIANQYQPGIVVPVQTTNGNSIMSWYTNDLSQFNYEVLLGTIPDAFAFKYSEGNYTKGGYSYRYICQFWNNTSFVYDQNNTYQNWLNKVNVNKGIFGSIGVRYDSSLLNEDTISFKQVQTNADTIDLSQSYSYPSLKEYYEDVSRTKAYPNGDYISADPISNINYPTTIVIEDDVAEIVLPFPDSYEIEDDPVIEYPIDDVLDPDLINDQIPIISGLQNKFPFSIPWDIASILKGMEAERETPYINTDVFIPGVNYTWHIEYDLHEFDDLAALFRTLFLISFILGLAYFSYDHFFGS